MEKQEANQDNQVKEELEEVPNEVKVSLVNINLGGKKKLSHHIGAVNEDFIVLYGGTSYWEYGEPNGSIFVYHLKEDRLERFENENIYTSVPMRGVGALYQDRFFTYGGRVEAEEILDEMKVIPVDEEAIKAQYENNRLKLRLPLKKEGEKLVPEWEQLETNGTWEIPRKRNGAAFAKYQNKIYVHGGYDGDKTINGMWVYDMKENLWSFIHPKGDTVDFIPEPRFDHRICLGEGKLYLFGGNGLKKPDHNIYVMDLKTKKWQEPIKLPTDLYPKGIASHSLSVMGDQLIIVGGKVPVETHAEMIDEYNIKPVKHLVVTYDLKTKECKNDYFLNFENIKSRIGHTAHVYGDQLWIIGGDNCNACDEDVVILKNSRWTPSRETKAIEGIKLKNDFPTEKRKSYPPPTPPFDSVIINHKQGYQINKWHGELRQQWKLLYRASRDGWTANNWHSKVDNHGPTITILKHAQGYIFGGYTPIVWASSGADKYDDKSWIFTLVHPNDNNSYKFDKIPQSVVRQRSVYHAASYGPWFGNNDIIIYSNPNTSTSSNAKLGKAYRYTLSYDPAKFFVGSANFSLQEIETFSAV